MLVVAEVRKCVAAHAGHLGLVPPELDEKQGELLRLLSGRERGGQRQRFSASGHPGRRRGGHEGSTPDRSRPTRSLAYIHTDHRHTSHFHFHHLFTPHSHPLEPREPLTIPFISLSSDTTDMYVHTSLHTNCCLPCKHRNTIQVYMFLHLYRDTCFSPVKEKKRNIV